MHSAASLEDIASRTPSTQLLSNLIPENSFSFAATPPTILHVKMEKATRAETNPDEEDTE